MTRIVTTAAVILLLTFFVGCETNTGTSQNCPMRIGPRIPREPTPNQPLAAPTSSDEIDLVEKMTANRQAYQTQPAGPDSVLRCRRQS